MVESQNTIVRSVETCLSSYLLQILKEKLERSNKKVKVASTIVRNYVQLNFLTFTVLLDFIDKIHLNPVNKYNTRLA